MKGVSGETFWVIITLVLALVAIGLFVLFSPTIVDKLTGFGAAVFEWLKHLV
jgi:hypothetical protein